MSLRKFCDDRHEGIWFRSLSQNVGNIPITRIRQRGLKPYSYCVTLVLRQTRYHTS